MSAYVRFVVPNWINRTTNKPIGVIRAAGTVQHRLSVKDQDELQELFEWFNDFLAIPRRFCKSARAVAYAENKALSWFKDTAKLHISKAREVAEVLEGYNLQTEMIVDRKPGYVVYEDEDQVAAIPFS